MGALISMDLIRRLRSPSRANVRPNAPEQRAESAREANGATSPPRPLASAPPAAGRGEVPPARGPAAPLPVFTFGEAPLPNPLAFRAPRLAVDLPPPHPLDIPAAMGGVALVLTVAIGVTVATLPWRMALDAGARILEEW